MPSKAKTVKEYLSELPEDRRRELEAVRKVILENLDAGYEEGTLYGMIGYYVPYRLFPAGYHCDPTKPLMYAAVAAQKNYLSVYLMSIYGSPGELKWFKAAWEKSGKKLDMGKSCIRFKTAAEVPLDVIGEAIKRVPAKKYVAHYLELLGDRGKPKSSKASAAQKVAMRRTSAKNSSSKSATRKR